MKTAPHKKNDAEEVVVHSDSDSEFIIDDAEASEVSCEAKLKKLRDELAEARKERDEHLAGWQRAKADLVNYRRVITEDKVRDMLRAKGAVVRSIIPALDSFETAIASESWKSASVEWREGVERIRNQLVKALGDEGLVLFGEAGEPFNPTHHECVSVVATDVPEKDHVVEHVLQRGYALEDEIIRPAKVIVAQIPEHT